MIDNVTFIVSPRRFRFGPAPETDFVALQLLVADKERAFRQAYTEDLSMIVAAVREDV